MTRAHEDSRATPHLGGVTAILVFAFTLVAFVAESELTGVRTPTPRALGMSLISALLTVRSKQPRISCEFLHRRSVFSAANQT